MVSKKGLSGIVTTILFILLVIVAVGIVWAFLNPFLGQGSSDIGAAGDCLRLRLEANSCVNNSATNYNVSVSRGGDNVELVGIKLIFYDSQDNTEVNETGIIPSAPGSRTYSNQILTSISGATKFGVIGVITVDGEPRTCDQVSQLKSCN